MEGENLRRKVDDRPPGKQTTRRLGGEKERRRSRDWKKELRRRVEESGGLRTSRRILSGLAETDGD